MRIEIRARQVPTSEELRAHVERRFEKVARQVSELAELELDIREEPHGANGPCWRADATLRLKGVTLRATDEAPDGRLAVNLIADDLTRQVKRHRDKRRARRAARSAQPEQAA